MCGKRDRRVLRSGGDRARRCWVGRSEKTDILNRHSKMLTTELAKV